MSLCFLCVFGRGRGVILKQWLLEQFLFHEIMDKDASRSREDVRSHWAEQGGAHPGQILVPALAMASGSF